MPKHAGWKKTKDANHFEEWKRDQAGKTGLVSLHHTPEVTFLYISDDVTGERRLKKYRHSAVAKSHALDYLTAHGFVEEPEGVSDEERDALARKRVKQLNAHAWYPIADQETAARLMAERLSMEQMNDEVFDHLSTDRTSAEAFERPDAMDPSWGIFFVDTKFLASRRGNRLRELSRDRVREVYGSGQKFYDVPSYDLRKGEVDEGNHRVWLLDGIFPSVPVKIDGW